jgi:4-amino-4-deoxy-L-arabinose transferase-like glycosyltransferase
MIRRPALWIFLLALLARLVFALVLPGDRLLPAGGDQGLYDRLAASVAQGRGLSFRQSDADLKRAGNAERSDSLADWVRRPDHHFGITPAEQPSSVIPPLYPVSLGLVYRVAGNSNYLVVRLLQSLLGALAALAIYGTARCCFRSDVLAAVLAGAVAALYPYLVYYTGLLAGENLYVPLLSATAWALTCLVAGPGVALPGGGEQGRCRLSPTALALLVGLFSGLTFLTRSSIILYLPLAALLMLYALGRRRGVMAVLLCGLAFAVTVSPWVVRNYRVHDEFVLMPTKGGLNLWMRNHPDVVRQEFLEAGLGFPDGLAARLEKTELLEYPDLEGLSEVERNQLITRRAVSFISANPRYFASLCVRRFVWLMSVTGSRSRGMLYLVVGLLSYGLVLPLAASGAYLAWRRRIRGALVPVSLVLYTIGLHTLFHGGIRYRLPVDPLMGILAAYAVAALWQWGRAARRGGDTQEVGR